jgi:hypothetical protein
MSASPEVNRVDQKQDRVKANKNGVNNTNNPGSGGAGDGSGGDSPEKRRHGAYGWEIPKLWFCNKDGGDRKEIPGQWIYRIKLEESIDNLCVFGEVKFYDPGRYRKVNAFADGRDYIFFELKSNEKSIGQDKYTGIFEIVNMVGEEAGRLVGGIDHITFSIAQYPAYRNSVVWKVSKGYKDKKISEIVEDIFNEFLNKDNNGSENKYRIDNTLDHTKYKLKDWCIPYWAPYRTINYLMPFAMNPNKEAGYHCFFDLDRRFHFRSLKHLIQGDPHYINLQGEMNIGQKFGENDDQRVITDYYAGYANRQFDKVGLSGASTERFQFYKKRHYTKKRGYMKRDNKEINKLYEKEEDINNMWGQHFEAMWPWHNSKELVDATTKYYIHKSVAMQCQNRLLLHGSIGNPKIKPGDKVIIKKKPSVDMAENAEELRGEWFIRAINHLFSPCDHRQSFPYRQVLTLSRSEPFDHSGG